MEKKIKVAILGLGGVGRELVRDFTSNDSFELTAVFARNVKQIGRDAGIIAGLEQPLGIQVTSIAEQNEVFSCGIVDVLIHCAGANNAVGTYEQVIPALSNGVSVITANVETTDLWSTDPGLAQEIDELCRANNCCYFGMGSSQLIERTVIYMTEGSKDISSISFTHHADVHMYSEKSNRETLGIGISKEEFEIRRKEAEEDTSKMNSNLTSIKFLADYFGWKIDRVERSFEPVLTEEDVVYGTTELITGYEGGKKRIGEEWTFILDPENRYYDKFVIKGTPDVEAVMDYSCDRGLCTTFAAIRNAVPVILKLTPGYKSSLDIPVCSWRQA